MPKIGTGRVSLDGIAAVTMTLASVLLIWGTTTDRRTAPTKRDRPVVKVPAEPIAIVDAHFKGNPRAKVALIGYSDFECPYCGLLARDTIPTLQAKYIDTGKVKLVFRHLPLATIHPAAAAAAQAAECAATQDRFWDMHDALFRDPNRLDTSALKDHARSIGLNIPAFTGCLEAPQSPRVKRDLEEAARLGIRGTPTVLFGTVDNDGRVRVEAVEMGAIKADRAIEIVERLLKS